MTFMWYSSHMTNWSTNKLSKLVGSKYFGNLPYFVLIIFFSTRFLCAYPTVIICSRNDNFRNHRNIALQVGAFLSKLLCFLFFTFSTKGFNLTMQVPTAERHNDRISLTSLWLLTSDQSVNMLIHDSASSEMICASWESISIMYFLPFLSNLSDWGRIWFDLH